MHTTALMGSADRVQLEWSVQPHYCQWLSLRALVQRRIQVTADKGKEKYMKTKDIYKASSGAKTCPSPPTDTHTTHKVKYIHTHISTLPCSLIHRHVEHTQRHKLFVFTHGEVPSSLAC